MQYVDPIEDADSIQDTNGETAEFVRLDEETAALRKHVGNS